jgi:hypothetical protein
LTSHAPNPSSATAWSFYKGDIYAKFLDYPDQRHDDDLHIGQQWMLEKEV